jgi:hypothetical protein
MTTNFANSSPFASGTNDWRAYANSLFEQQGQAPKYDLSTPMPTFQQNINKVWGSTAQSPFAATQAAAQGHSAATQAQLPQSSGGGFLSGGLPSGYQHSAPTMRGYEKSPYLDQMATSITGQFNKNLTEGILPGIRGQAVATGGVGGSRQGIAEGQAIAGSQRGLADALTGMYSQDYQQDRARALQQYQADQGYMLGNRGMDVNMRQQDIGWQLGQRGLDLQGQGLRDNFYTAQRGQDITRLGIGANLLGNTIGTLSGNSNGQGGSSGFDWQAALGGALSGLGYSKSAGWL